MDNTEIISKTSEELYLQYIYLIEEAYNLSETDQAQSDIVSFEATKILDRLNQLEFSSEEQFV